MALLQSWGSLLTSGTCHDHYRRRGVRPLTLAFIVYASTTTVAITARLSMAEDSRLRALLKLP